MPQPRLAAGVLPIRPGASGPEVLVLRRAAALAYLPGFHSLPGGHIDADDERVPLDGSFADAAARAAALRELFEETSILALSGGALDDDERASLRAATRAPGRFARELEARGLTLAASRLVPLYDWLTPEYTQTHYRARYYLLAVRADTAVDPAPAEVDEALWLTPAAALERQRRGELALTFVLLETLRQLVATGPSALLRGAPLALPPYTHPGGEMLAGVHLLALRAPTLPPNTTTNTYLLGGAALVVVDPAPPDDDERAALLGYLESLRAQGSRVRAIWLTHHHHDHVGAAAWLRERTAAPVLAHPWTASALAGDFAVDGTIDEGSELELALDPGRSVTWRALHLPGHCPGHLAFYAPESGALVAGDLVAGEGTVIVAPPEGDMSAYLTSLDRVLALPLRFVFPGHGPPTGAPHARLREYVEHRRARESAIIGVLARAPGALAPEEIVPSVYTDVSPASWPLAAQNVLAHLEMLRGEGRVGEKDGRFVLLREAGGAGSS